MLPRTLRTVLAASLAVLTAMSAFLAATPLAASAVPDVDGTRATAVPDLLARPTPSGDPLAKLSPGIREAARLGSDVRAVIVTDDVFALGVALRTIGVDTRIGTAPATAGGLRAVVVEAPARLLGKVAALEAVHGIAPAVRPELPVRADADVPSDVLEGLAPALIEAGRGHHVLDAWAAGYRGAGVRVAPLDSGTDFGHPDLQGTFAVVTDPSSPYVRWPIAFDPASMELHLFFNATFPTAAGSWYVNTSFATTANPVTRLTTTPFQGRTYNVSGVPSASGVYRLGLHPDGTLRSSSLWNYQEYVGMLVTDSTVPGVYDTVVVDLDNDRAFGDDKRANRSSPEIWADYYDASTDTWDNASYASGDGIADMSGGLVYFIADGANPVPYADVIGARYGLPVPVPGAGDLVALQLGDATAPGGDHGTFVASAIVAQNVTGRVHGFAPDARLISVGNVYASGFLFLDIFTFAAEGYDAIPGTGDEAHVASASFGISSIHNDGWDFFSRWVDLHAYSSLGTTYVVSTGNGGHGFGTVTSPSSSPGVVAVGASTSYHAGLGAFEAAGHATFGDVQPWSNRGPSAAGFGRPDVVAVGAWASGDGALNAFGGRTPPWAVWGGTSLSTPAAAGILALILEAHEAAIGGPVPNYLAKIFLTAGADNIHYDPLVMGHGLANALRSVRAAALVDGLAAANVDGWVPVGSWAAGGYRGTPYTGFARILSPGATNATVLELWNWNATSAKDVAISDWELRRTTMDTFTVNASDANESAPDFLRPDYAIDLTARIPPGTALLKATVTFPFDEFDPERDYAYNSRWRVVLYNWRDADGNGSYWTDADGNGVVNEGELDAAAGPEFARFTYAYPSHTNLQAVVHDPLARIDDGLVLGIQHRTTSPAVPRTNLTVTVEYFAAVDAPWLSASATVLTLPAGPAAVPLTLTVTLPPDAPLGTLSGVVTISNATTGETQIPVLVNVAATGPTFRFGGDPNGTRFLDPSRVSGGPDWTWRPESGDWRFVFTDIPDDTPIAPGERLLVHTSWERVPTDIDTLVLGPTPDPLFSPTPLWGPYTLSVKGQSPDWHLGSGRYAFNTITGGADEWVTAPLAAGLHEIALHNVLYAGVGPSEVVRGEVGTMRLSPTVRTVGTTDGRWTGAFTAVASLDLPRLDVRAYGVAAPKLDEFLPIAHLGTYTEAFAATSIGVIDVRIDDPGGLLGLDLDLYLERLTPSGWFPVASSAGFTSTEAVRVTTPPDGTYRIRVVGFNVPTETAGFRLYRAIVAGRELTPSGAPSGPVPAGTPASFNVTLALDPGTPPGFYIGAVFAGPPGAPVIEAIVNFVAGADTSPPALVLTSPETSVTRTPWAIVAGTTDADASVAVNGVPVAVDASGAFLANVSLVEGPNPIVVVATDPAGNAATASRTVTLDTVPPALSVATPAGGAVLGSTAVRVAGTTEPGAELTVNGLRISVDASGAWAAEIALADGARTLTTTARDAAGNVAQDVRTVTVDTVAPSASIDLAGAPGRDGWFVSAVTVTLTGTDATSGVAALEYRIGAGPWTPYGGPFDLADGTYAIAYRAIDAAGNVGPEGTAGVRVDATAPIVSITSPPQGTETEEASVQVTGVVDDPTAVVIVNGEEVRPDPVTGEWRTVVALLEGANRIDVSAVDAAGNVAPPLSPLIVTYISPLREVQEGMLSNTQALANLALWVGIGIVAAAIILIVLQLALFWTLDRKIEALGRPRGSGRPPPPPPEPPSPDEDAPPRDRIS